jgi:REP element-mobilizing transposase RayT
LIRVKIGGFELGTLAAGEWRELSGAERAAVFTEKSHERRTEVGAASSRSHIRATPDRPAVQKEHPESQPRLFLPFDRAEPVANLTGHLPHWRQRGTTYFVTFRTADSLPREKLDQWNAELAQWLRSHSEPYSEADRNDYFDRFPKRFQFWLDQGYGACVLGRIEAKLIVERALRHFDGTRYQLGEFVVMPNHVHALVTPFEDYELSAILHSWKSYTATEINRRLGSKGPFWQRETFDHIVRNADSLEGFARYIRENPRQ